MVESAERLFGLLQQFALIGRKGHFRIAFEACRTDIGLVVARTVDAVAQEILQFTCRLVEFAAQSREVSLKLRSDLFLLGSGPWLFVGTHGQLDL